MTKYFRKNLERQAFYGQTIGQGLLKNLGETGAKEKVKEKIQLFTNTLNYIKLLKWAAVGIGLDQAIMGNATLKSTQNLSFVSKCDNSKYDEVDDNGKPEGIDK